jgi:hypothetical protein
MRKLLFISIFIVPFLFCLNASGQSAQSNSIQISSRAVISNENRFEDIKKLFEDITQKITSVIRVEFYKKEFRYFSYSKPKFNIINQSELEINVELKFDTINEQPTFDNYGGILALEFLPKKFSNQADLNKNVGVVKGVYINKIKRDKKQFFILQEDPLIFRFIGQEFKGIDAISIPQTDSINLSALFPNQTVSNSGENTLIYNVGIAFYKPNLKSTSSKNVNHNIKNLRIIREN